MKKINLLLIILSLIASKVFAEGGGGGGSSCNDDRKFQCLGMAEDYFLKNAKFQGYQITDVEVYDQSICGASSPGREQNLFTFKLIPINNYSAVERWGVAVETTNTRPCKVYSMQTYKR